MFITQKFFVNIFKSFSLFRFKEALLLLKNCLRFFINTNIHISFAINSNCFVNVFIEKLLFYDLLYS